MSATFHECLQNRRQHNIPYFSIEFIANSINGLNACGLWLLFNPPCTLKCHINDVSHLICSIQVSCRRVRNFSWSLRAASRAASHLLRLVTWRMNRFADGERTTSTALPIVWARLWLVLVGFCSLSPTASLMPTTVEKCQLRILCRMSEEDCFRWHLNY